MHHSAPRASQPVAEAGRSASVPAVEEDPVLLLADKFEFFVEVRVAAESERFSKLARLPQVFYGLPFVEGDRILTSLVEYGSNYLGFLQARVCHLGFKLKNLGIS